MSHQLAMTRVSVFVVNWNSGDLLHKSLDCLLRQTLPPARILVVDNGSSDGSVERIRELPNVTTLLAGANLGFAEANNRAIQQCDTEFVALLNPDAFPESDWLKKLVAAAQAYPEVAAFGSRQMVHESERLVDGLGDVYHFSGLVWRRGYGRKLKAADEVPVEIFSPCAGAALYRTEAIKAVGGFDKDFFCYVEDVDLGFRLRLAGYQAMLVPDAVVHHVGSATTGGQHSGFSIYHGHRNLVWAYVKNMPGWLFWAFLPLHLLMNVLVVMRFAITGQGNVILRAKKDAILGLPKAWRKRAVIQANRKASIAEIFRILDKRIWPRR